MSLIGFTIIRNWFKYDYLLREAVFSVLPAVDRHIIVECYSEDNTYDEVLKMARKEPKIMVLRHPWGDDMTVLQRAANFAISHVGAGDWFFQIQADEVLHEDSLPILSATPRLLQDANVITARPYYWHFMANYNLEFDFMYRRKIVIAQQGHGWEWDGDACQLMNGSGTTADIDMHIYHYGKVHEAKKGLAKEQAFQWLYRDIGLGFPDPSLKLFEKKLGGADYFYLFRHAVKSGQVRQFTGAHPAIMAERIAQAGEDGWEQFEAKLSLEREPHEYGDQ